MGNCQAVDAAALVIQHPNGNLERMYWPLTASDVMKSNPGHYVSLIIPLTTTTHDAADDENRTVRYTRVKLLRPTDKLVLGRAYRLVTTQEVMKVLRAKKHAKMNKDLSDSNHLQPTSHPHPPPHHATRPERHRQRSASTTAKSWRPSLQSISEGGS